MTARVATAILVGVLLGSYVPIAHAGDGKPTPSTPRRSPSSTPLPTSSTTTSVDALDDENDLNVGATITSPGSTYSADGTATTTSQVASSSAATPPPTLIPNCEHGGAIGLDNAYGCTGKQLECEGGLVYTVITYAADGSSTTDPYECIKEGEPLPGVKIDIPGEVLSQFKKVGLPSSDLVVQPPNGKTLVNLPTIFSTNAPRFLKDVFLDKVGITVELEIWADSFTWHFGDGQTLTNKWAGEAWGEGKDVSKLLTHTYATVEKDVQVKVDTTWTAKWRVKGTEGWSPLNATVTVEGQAQELDVLEAKPLLVKR